MVVVNRSSAEGEMQVRLFYLTTDCFFSTRSLITGVEFSLTLLLWIDFHIAAKCSFAMTFQAFLAFTHSPTCNHPCFLFHICSDIEFHRRICGVPIMPPSTKFGTPMTDLHLDGQKGSHWCVLYSFVIEQGTILAFIGFSFIWEEEKSVKQTIKINCFVSSQSCLPCFAVASFSLKDNDFLG